MTHDSAVRTVVSLVPEIEKRGAAAVLTDYATREDLPPAQLEKLAQVYNTLRTVSHIDHSDVEERGATVPLVDVPTLVVGYATGIGQEKGAAGPHSFSSHDSRTVNLNLALQRDLGLKKAAAQGKGAPAAAEELFKQSVSHEQAQDALLHLEIELQDEMSKLASALFSAAPRVGDGHFCRDISEFEEEALQYQPASVVKAAGDYMEKFAAPHRTKLVRFDYSQKVQPYAYDIGHQWGQKFAELAKAASTLEVIVKMAVATEEEVRKAGPSPDAKIDPITLHAGPKSEDSVELSPAMINAMFGGGGMAAPPKLDPQQIDPEAPPAPEADEEADEEEADSTDDKLRSAETFVSSTKAAPAPAGGKAETAPARRPESAQRASSSDSSGAAAKGGGGVTKDDILALLAAPVTATRDAVQGAARKADETLTSIVGKERQNKAQKASDLSVEDIRRAMAIRRLIGTDPVLREADPKDVLEVYNSVVARNPELAGDMASLRLVLREAVSYEGLTLDSQKLLTEIRRNSEQADSAAADNEKRRYAVGGTSPIPIAKV